MTTVSGLYRQRLYLAVISVGGFILYFYFGSREGGFLVFQSYAISFHSVMMLMSFFCKEPMA